MIIDMLIFQIKCNLYTISAQVTSLRSKDILTVTDVFIWYLGLIDSTVINAWNIEFYDDQRYDNISNKEQPLYHIGAGYLTEG